MYSWTPNSSITRITKPGGPGSPRRRPAAPHEADGSPFVAPQTCVRAVVAVMAVDVVSYARGKCRRRRTLTAVGTLSAVVKPSFNSLGVDQHSSLPAHATPEQP